MSRRRQRLRDPQRLRAVWRARRKAAEPERRPRAESDDPHGVASTAAAPADRARRRLRIQPPRRFATPAPSDSPSRATIASRRGRGRRVRAFGRGRAVLDGGNCKDRAAAVRKSTLTFVAKFGSVTPGHLKAAMFTAGNLIEALGGAAITPARPAKARCVLRMASGPAVLAAAPAETRRIAGLPAPAVDRVVAGWGEGGR